MLSVSVINPPVSFRKTPLPARLSYLVMQSQGSVVTCTGRGVVQAEDVLQILKYQDLSNATLFFSFLRSDPNIPHRRWVLSDGFE